MFWIEKKMWLDERELSIQHHINQFCVFTIDIMRCIIRFDL